MKMLSKIGSNPFAKCRIHNHSTGSTAMKLERRSYQASPDYTGMPLGGSLFMAQEKADWSVKISKETTPIGLLIEKRNIQASSFLPSEVRKYVRTPKCLLVQSSNSTFLPLAKVSGVLLNVIIKSEREGNPAKANIKEDIK